MENFRVNPWLDYETKSIHISVLSVTLMNLSTFLQLSVSFLLLQHIFPYLLSGRAFQPA
jgi:hypothetical protein